MKNLITVITLLSSILFSQYLQDTLYPECSYVIVDEQGWKIHKNQNGKTISMTPISKHNIKSGKYSFDKFGNLVPFKECSTELVNTYEDSDSIMPDITIDIEFSFLKNINFSVYGGMSIPFGENIDSYEIAPTGGAELKIGNLNLSLNIMAFEYEKQMQEEGTIFYRKNSLSSNNIFLGYTLYYKKLYVTPKIGMFNRTFEASGAGLVSEKQTGTDLGFGGELGYDFGKISLYGSGSLSTTMYETEQTATFYNFGLKYTF
jgi:hypothetical protein